MVITDSQIHLWEAHRPDRPWPAEEVERPTFVAAPGARPHRQAPLGAEEMVGMMNAVGIARSIIVPPSPAGDLQNLTAMEAVRRFPGRFGIMGRFDPLAEGARGRLETWLELPGMLGVRMTFHKPQWAPWLDNDEIEWFWAACERLGIPVMLLIPGRMDAVDRIAARHPDLNLIIDHMGRKSAARDDECFADLDDMLALGRHAKVSVKASSAPCYSTRPFPFRNLTSHLRRILDAFGPRRMFWGSDVTRLPCTYAECLEHFLYHLDFLKGDDKAWVMGRGLAETLRWPESGPDDLITPTEDIR